MRAFEKLLPLVVIGTALASVFAVACSSSSGGSGPGSVSSVDSTKTVNGLSDAEAKQYCEDVSNYSAGQLSEADAKRLVCGVTAQIFGGYGAASDAEAQTKCKAQLDECMNKPTQKSDSDAGADGSDDCTDFKNKAKSCTATVGEVNQCLSDRAAAMKAAASKDFCAQAKVISRDGNTSAATPYEEPASCKAIAAKCPAIGGDDSGSDG